eukprot:TRINITY_DN4270_c0_g2_i2.p1 TRINITY_DN4270_c0_g2~~TRINITY_DN4270_c0_g2_i2.p1  ORF type:complete len:112 (+),score=28.95 TRINITY_DN4270_c0_g2_i2:2-337(+)
MNAQLGGNDESSAITEQHVVDYLRDVVPLLLGGDAVTLFNALQANIDVIREFASDPKRETLMIHHRADEAEANGKGEEEDDDTTSSRDAMFVVTTEASRCLCAIIFVFFLV